MKKLIFELLRKNGYKLTKVKTRLPAANFESIALAMEYFVAAQPDAVFFQVGACDGYTSDCVNTHVKTGRLRSVLIEPIPDNFRKLSEFYQGTPNTILVNAAVAQQDGKANIFSVKNEGRWKDSAYARQLASFDRSHLSRIGILDDEVEICEVDCLTLQTLLNRHQLPSIDILQIDTEGFDHEIVKMALKLEKLPRCICFENCQIIKIMSQQELKDFFDLLENAGYQWFHDRINTMAIHNSFIKAAEPEANPLVSK